MTYFCYFPIFLLNLFHKNQIKITRPLNPIPFFFLNLFHIQSNKNYETFESVLKYDKILLNYY